MKLKCYSCQKEIEIHLDSFTRKEQCDHCYADLHSCRMCEHYDTSSYNECREPMAERIVDKEKANFCDYFKISYNSNQNRPDKDDLMAQAEALFKK